MPCEPRPLPLSSSHWRREHLLASLNRELALVQSAQTAHHLRDAGLRKLVHSVTNAAKKMLEEAKECQKQGLPSERVQVCPSVVRVRKGCCLVVCFCFLCLAASLCILLPALCVLPPGCVFLRLVRALTHVRLGLCVCVCVCRKSISNIRTL